MRTRRCRRRSDGWAAASRRAMTQNNLGIALFVLRERGDDDAPRRALECYEGALEEFSRRDAPADVALTEQKLA